MTPHAHFLGICGYAVGGAALIAQQLGWTVTGSDEDAYPPMSDTLTAAGIRWSNQHRAANLLEVGRPDVVVVGNQARDDNPEWAEAVRQGIRVTSEVEFYGELTADRVRVAVCGTHGKTTTSSLLAWLLEVAGQAPGFRLGTTSRDFGGASARLGRGPFVYEGDEYTTAPWDSRPKFLHAHPWAACVTSLELDHPDVYASLEAYRQPFSELVASMPADGVVLLSGDDPACLALAPHATSRVETYGLSGSADWTVEVLSGQPTLQRIRIRHHDTVIDVDLPLPGLHNAQNAVAAVALAAHLGVATDQMVAALPRFQGASRRFEMVGRPAAVVVIDDYAHHPTEVRATVAAARTRFPEARLFSVYVPHTYSRTKALLQAYGDSFTGSDVLFLGPIEPARERHLEGTVSSADIATIVAGVADIRLVAGAEEVIASLGSEAQPGDVILCMSVRGFDDLARRLVTALERARVG